MALLTLGPHVFDILPVNLQRIRTRIVMNWPAIARFGGVPARQAVGQGEHAITISGLVFNADFGGYADYRAIGATALAQKPLMMLGLGTATAATVFGQVVILEVSDEQDYIGPDGIGQRLAFDIEVAPFGGDGPYGSLFG